MKIMRVVLPVAIVLAGFAITKVMMATAPQPEKKPPEVVIPTVEVLKVEPGDYRVKIRSQGTVEPRTQSTLVAEVSGKVISVADNFNAGGYFEKGDVLLQIDPRDYQAAVTIAKSDLAQQRLNLQQEKAQSEQARRDWEGLGNGGAPGDLVLRKPQMASATAAVAAAEARLAQAEADLERTRIRAPYAGRILEKNVDVGQFVSPGTVLATIYAIDYAEINLPLNDEQMEYLQLPEQYRGDQSIQGPAVTLHKGANEWPARIVRSAGAVDSKSRQQFVVARVDDPYGHNEAGRPPLKVGMFVEGEIAGDTLQDVFVVPRAALRENSYLLLVRDGKLRQQPVDIAWTDDKEVVIRQGLTSGDQVVVSPLAYAVDGTAVKIVGEKSSESDSPNKSAEGESAR